MMSAFLRRFVLWASATLLLVAISAPVIAQEKKYKPLVVRTPDGVTIAAQEWGNPSGSEILFIHGFSQASLSWQREVESDLAKEFCMVTYDLRGHGNSDKPFEPEKYKESKPWADEVQAVIDVAKLKRPVLVGWSFGDGLKVLPLMLSDDLATNITATRIFLHNCFEKQPSADDFETMLAFNMMVPPKVRAGLSGRPLDATEIMSKLAIPVLVSHGAEDKNAKVETAKYTASVIPGAKLSIYDGTGHSPFYEDAPRFNSELAALVRTANKGN